MLRSVAAPLIADNSFNRSRGDASRSMAARQGLAAPADWPINSKERLTGSGRGNSKQGVQHASDQSENNRLAQGAADGLQDHTKILLSVPRCVVELEVSRPM
jgi:hypothetical protein